MKDLIERLQGDLFRITGSKKKWFGLFFYLYKPEFSYLFFLRIANYLFKRKSKLRLFVIRIPLGFFSALYGYEIPFQTDIGTGFRLVHRGGVIINPLAKIQNNVTIYRGVTIGSNRRGKRKGAPIIENNVVIFANAAVIGKVRIGSNVMIAPNAYVNFDVPSNSICLGNPAKIISKNNATEAYIDNPLDL